MAKRGKTGRFTAEQVRAIRSDSRTLRKVAADYGVTYAAIAKIKNREMYRDVE